MNVIMSHDVDHLTALEHCGDLLLLKRIVRSCIEFSLGYASCREVVGRVKDICRNRLQNLEKMIAFDRENGVPSTFFFGMANGKYLSYKLNDAKYWIKRVMASGLNVGVHGISFDDLAEMMKEYASFKKITGLTAFGNRMHYLRMSEGSLGLLEEVGYAFDTSIEGMAAPYKFGNIWEFPLHVMDVSVFNGGKGWRTGSLGEAKEKTKDIIRYTRKQKVGYLTVCFHDTYFCSSYQDIYDWYRWLIDYARYQKFTFMSYDQAMKNLGAHQNR